MQVMVKIDDVPFAKGGTLFRKCMLALCLHSHCLIVAIFISNRDTFLSDISNSFLTLHLAYYCPLIFRPSLGLSHARYAPYEARYHPLPIPYFIYFHFVISFFFWSNPKFCISSLFFLLMVPQWYLDSLSLLRTLSP